MISENRALIIVSPITVIGPGLMLASLVVGLNLFTEGLARARPHRQAGREVRPAPSPGAALVEVEDLSVAYHHDDGWLRVVDGVNFTIARSEALGLVGERRLRQVDGRLPPARYRRPGSRVDSGRIIFQGVDLLRLGRPALDSLRGNRISLVPQNPAALSPGMRVGEQIAEVLRWHDRKQDAGSQAPHRRVVRAGGLARARAHWPPLRISFQVASSG